MASHYNEALTDGDLHSLRHEISVLEARARELLSRTETSDLAHAWVDLSKAWEAFSQARTRQDVPAMGEALPVVEAQIRRGLHDYLLWGNLEQTFKTLATLRYQEHKRLIDLQAVITEERALLIFGQIQQTIRDVVLKHADKDQATRILTEAQQAFRVYDLELVS
jgi:hypothetical protein